MVLAVRSSQQIRDVIGDVTRTGLQSYDGTTCKSEGFAELSGLVAFDPSADGADGLWMNLLHLILVCFKCAGDSDWGLFPNTMDRIGVIGQSMEVADVEEKYANHEFEDKDDRLSLDGQPGCLQWAYIVNCDRSSNGGQGSCRYKHLCTAG